MLGHGDEGVQVRVIGAREAYKLLGGRGWDATEDVEADAQAILHHPPYALAALAADFVGELTPNLDQPAPDRSRFHSKGEPECAQKTGSCKLPWEDETEALVLRWLGQRLDTRCAGMGKGGKKGEERDAKAKKKAARLRGSFRARSDDDRRRLVKVLRHEAPLLNLPIREDGWVSLEDVNALVGEMSLDDAHAIIAKDDKDRLILCTEANTTWIAAVSGHSIGGVVGPGRELPEAEIPEILVHGSYAKHTNAIVQKGLYARRAIHLLACGSKHGRWRSDIETSVFVRARAAARTAKVRILLTTNSIYLAPDGIPAEYVVKVASWRSGSVPFLPKTEGPSVERFAPGMASNSRQERTTSLSTAAKAEQRAQAVAEHQAAERFTDRQAARRKLSAAAPRGTVGMELQRELESDCESCSDRRERATHSAAEYATRRFRALGIQVPSEPVELKPRVGLGTPAAENGEPWEIETRSGLSPPPRPRRVSRPVRMGPRPLHLSQGWPAHLNTLRKKEREKVGTPRTH